MFLDYNQGLVYNKSTRKPYEGSIFVSGQRRQISNCDSFSWIYGLGMAFLAIIVPSLPSLFGISALFARYRSFFRQIIIT